MLAGEDVWVGDPPRSLCPRPAAPALPSRLRAPFDRLAGGLVGPALGEAEKARQPGGQGSGVAKLPLILAGCHWP